MGQLIDQLKELQRLDAEIAKLTEEKDRWPAIIGEKKNDVQAIEKQKAQKEDELKSARVDVEGLELKLRTGEEDIGKRKNTLLSVKTNREYEAILHEIEGIKAENSMVEEKIIRGLDLIEGIEAAVKELDGEIRNALAEVEDMERQASSEIKEIDEEIGDLETEKKSSLDSLDADILHQYERVRTGRHGLAVVPVLDNVCQGCFMTLTPQEVNSLLIADDTLITCRSCQRILYIEE